jgi:two-component system NtrC family sensor kinase
VTNILVLDDERDILEPMCDFLKLDGYRPVGLASVRCPDDLYLNGSFDVIIIDIMLKGPLSGVEVAKQLRSRVTCPLIGTSVSDEMLDVARKSEAFDHVVCKDVIQILLFLQEIGLASNAEVEAP